MEIIFKVINLIINSINKIIDSFDTKTVKSIKSGYFIFIFFSLLIASYIGYQNGKDSAKIKSPPLVPITNDTFLIEVNTEKEDGDFSSILKTNQLNTEKKEEIKKRGELIIKEAKIALEEGILEPQNELKLKTTPHLKVENRIFDTAIEPQKHDVKLLKKKKNITQKPVDQLKTNKKVKQKSESSLKIKKIKLKQKNKTTPKSIETNKEIFEN